MRRDRYHSRVANARAVRMAGRYRSRMRIWVDADGCPRDAKELVQRAAERLQIPAVFVANSDLRLPRSQFVSSVRVGAGLDVADKHIVDQAQPGDLAVT